MARRLSTASDRKEATPSQGMLLRNEFLSFEGEQITMRKITKKNEQFNYK
jgi:hypothetical protein